MPLTRCVAICFRLCWRHLDDLFVLALNPHKELWARSPVRSEVEERRKVQEKTEIVSWQSRGEETIRLDIAVQKMRQLAEGGTEKMEVRQRREPTEVRKMTAKTYRGRVNQHEKMSALLVAFVGVSRKIHARDSLQMHGELHKSVT